MPDKRLEGQISGITLALTAIIEQLPDENRTMVLERLVGALREHIDEAKEHEEAGHDSDFSFVYGFSLVMRELFYDGNTP